MNNKPLHSCAAPAKINLTLRVTGRMPDGYHALSSLAAFTDISDYIEIRESNDLKLDIQGPYAKNFSDKDRQENNLVWRAANDLAKHAGIAPRAHITLVKNLPLASGIGGGSSNAAATIKVLLKFWNIAEDLNELAPLLKNLGADVPVCYLGRAAYMTGKGEILKPVSLPGNIPLVLINPNISCSTAGIFAKLKSFSTSQEKVPSLQSMDNLTAFIRQNGNDLLQAALETVPEISEILHTLAVQDGCVVSGMSGSGATCFGLFENENSAIAAAEKLQAHASWWVKSGLLNPSA